jgi:hypothetical protein
MSRSSLIAFAVLFACTGCASSEPEPGVPGAAKYDRAFNAALGAAGDAGIEVRTSDRAAGRIYGSKGGAEIMIWLQWQPNGSTKVEFSPSGVIGQQWLSAYNRRMGR